MKKLVHIVIRKSFWWNFKLLGRPFLSFFIHEQLKPDPNALWSYRERWLNIQKMREELADIQQELDGKLEEY